jgi:radical SAM protein with 4Fe4S-binding SPASM domain
MECTETATHIEEGYLKEFNRKIAMQRIPISGTLDLTHRCNLRCIHCYIGKEDNGREVELKTGMALSILDEITDAGCLKLLITGGEPLLREDFKEIYTHAKNKGLLVTVFTNGTTINGDILDLFSALPPQAVEISLYGATEETYEKITGIKGSYKKCLKGIEGLLRQKVNVKLKTILMTLNSHEFFDMEDMARGLGVKFRFDASIFPRLNGDMYPVSLRVSPEEAAAKEFSERDRHMRWREFFEKNRNAPQSNTLYNCAAGLTSFYIDPYGNFQPCLMTQDMKYNLLEGNFLDGWHNYMPGIREKKAGNSNACHGCEMKLLCDFCPGFFKLEGGSEDEPSDYLCNLGKCRFKAIMEDFSKGGLDYELNRA